MKWWWIAFTDRALPVGEQARGAVICRAPTWKYALEFVTGYGLVPSPTARAEDFEALGGWMSEAHGDPPDGFAMRYLDNDEAAELARRWGGRAADREDIKRAFLDDDAREGDPLFKRGTP